MNKMHYYIVYDSNGYLDAIFSSEEIIEDKSNIKEITQEEYNVLDKASFWITPQ